MYEQEALDWRGGDNPPEWTGRTIYVGTSLTGRYYAVDDRDALPPDLVTFAEFQWLGVHLDGSRMANHGQELCALLNAAKQTERGGTPVTLSVGVFEYETADPATWTIPADGFADGGAPYSAEEVGVSWDEEVTPYADEHKSGQLRLATAGEQRSLLPLPDEQIPETTLTSC